MAAPSTPLECGVDEAGCGSLIGDLVAAAVILPPVFDHALLRDSKKLSAARRERAYDALLKSDAHIGVGVVRLDELNASSFGWARREVFQRALRALPVRPDAILVDGNGFFDGFEGIAHRCVVKGDSLHLSISAASIVAKVSRDASITEICNADPESAAIYGWASNMGYPSAHHLRAIKERGIDGRHRVKFRPCAAALVDSHDDRESPQMDASSL